MDQVTNGLVYAKAEANRPFLHQMKAFVSQVTLRCQEAALDLFDQIADPMPEQLLNKAVCLSSLDYPTAMPSELSVDKTSSVFRLVWTGLGALTTYHLIDSGLARSLALETLTHGTNVLNYISINLNGADPQYGGSDRGAAFSLQEPHYVEASRNYFHVMSNFRFDKGMVEHTPLAGQWMIASKARLYAMMSSENFFSFLSDYHLDFVKGLMGTLPGFLTPSLRFRFKPEHILNCVVEQYAKCFFLEGGGDSCFDNCEFMPDPNQPGALKTKNTIPTTHLGITGTLIQGLDSKVLERMSAHPEQVAMGVTFLALGILVGRVTYEIATRKDLTPLKRVMGDAAWAVALTAIFFNTL